MAVCTGSASLTPPERAELLTLLAEDADETVRDRAENALLSQPLDAFAAALAGENPAAHLLRYCGKHLVDKPAIAAALIKCSRCPMEFLTPGRKSLAYLRGARTDARPGPA